MRHIIFLLMAFLVACTSVGRNGLGGEVQPAVPHANGSAKHQTHTDKFAAENQISNGVLLAAKGYKNLALDLYRFERINAIRKCVELMDTPPYCTDFPDLSKLQNKIADINDKARMDIEQAKRSYIVNKTKALEQAKPDSYHQVEGCSQPAEELMNEMLSGEKQKDIETFINIYKECLQLRNSQNSKEETSSTRNTNPQPVDSQQTLPISPDSASATGGNMTGKKSLEAQTQQQIKASEKASKKGVNMLDSSQKSLGVQQ